MTEAAPNFELLLRRALAPVDPPAALYGRLEATLQSLTELAAEELETWELKAMRDPRNWVRPAAAVVIGTSAGAALVLLRARQRAAQRAQQRPDALHAARDAAERALDELGREARRLLGRD